MTGRQRLRESGASLSDHGNVASTLPVIRSPDALDRFGEFFIRGVRTVFTPMRAFATRKALLFVGLTATLIAGKLNWAYSGGKMIGQVLLADPTIGQTIVLSLTVIAFGWINLRAFQSTLRAKEISNSELIKLLRSRNIPAGMKQQILDQLRS